MEAVYLSLGSNVGNRAAYLQEAARLLGAQPQILIEKSSALYETSPVGDVPQADFFNQVLKISTSLSPEDLLAFTQSVEAQLHRTRELHWGPRTIDIDILFYGNQAISAANLTAPHPEAFNRLFVLKPLMEVVDSEFPYRIRAEAALRNIEERGDQSVNPLPAVPSVSHQVEMALAGILRSYGEDTERPGLLETPERVAKMYSEILSSTGLTDFQDYKLFHLPELEREQVILVKDVPFYSLCEHHMLPFFGRAHVAYLPTDGKIIGLSKVPRLVDFLSRKLNVQEKLTQEIVLQLEKILQPQGVAVVLEARHLCVEMRGVRKLDSQTRTSLYTGVFKNESAKRAEFLEALK